MSRWSNIIYTGRVKENVLGTHIYEYLNENICAPFCLNTASLILWSLIPCFDAIATKRSTANFDLVSENRRSPLQSISIRRLMLTIFWIEIRMIFWMRDGVNNLFNFNNWSKPNVKLKLMWFGWRMFWRISRKFLDCLFWNVPILFMWSWCTSISCHQKLTPQWTKFWGLGPLLHASSTRLFLKSAVIPGLTRSLRFSKRPRDSFHVRNSGNLYACTYQYYSSAIEFEEIKIPRPILYDRVINFIG
jgi:hypothetical protein